MWKLRFLAMIAWEGMFLGSVLRPIFGPKLSNRLLRNSFRMVLQNEADWKWQSEGIFLEATSPSVGWVFRRISWWWYGTSSSMESNSCSFDLVVIHVFVYSKRNGSCTRKDMTSSYWFLNPSIFVHQWMQSTTNSEIVAPNGCLGDLRWRTLLQRLSLHSPWCISFRLLGGLVVQGWGKRCREWWNGWKLNARKIHYVQENVC